jgi:hypothetical protein
MPEFKETFPGEAKVIPCRATLFLRGEALAAEDAYLTLSVSLLQPPFLPAVLEAAPEAGGNRKSGNEPDCHFSGQRWRRLWQDNPSQMLQGTA